MKTYFTSESVTCGHPDKVCDQIADAILDRILEQDPLARVACEVTVATGQIHIMGEVSTTAQVDYEAVARSVVREIGYVKAGHGFDAESCRVIVDLHAQSPDIAQGVNRGQELATGAGDQGMMFGYACDETDDYMPLPITLAHDLTKRLEAARQEGILPYLLPDGKAQVTVEYEGGIPRRISAVVLSAQHEDGVDLDSLRMDLVHEVIYKALPFCLLDTHTALHINPTGRFVIGGPAGDSGLTGRKIIVDTYGGYARHGGGAFSGKDATKVDRSAAYMARYIAKNIVAAGLAEKCEVQISYAIGLAEPVSVLIETFGTEKVPLASIRGLALAYVDLRPAAIIKQFGLRDPIYRTTACYGHFGRYAQDLPWETLGLSSQLKGLLHIYAPVVA